MGRPLKAQAGCRSLRALVNVHKVKLARTTVETCYASACTRSCTYEPVSLGLGIDEVGVLILTWTKIIRSAALCRSA